LTQAQSYSVEARRKLLEQMLTIRRAEEQVIHFATDHKDLIRGHFHVYIGQEASGVGACAALGPDDYVFTTHRNHGHVIARGGELGPVLAEIIGRTTGYNKGRGGTFHVIAPHLGILQTSGVVGGCVPLAAGAAFSIKQRGTRQASLVFFGDGVLEEGAFYEAVNLASLWKLPVVFVCENNGYGEYTPFEAVTPGGIVPRAAAMELRTSQADGMDVRSVRAAAAEIVARVRSGEGPEFVELRTYRFVGHSRSDPGKYRPEGELDRWRERDPLIVGASLLRDELGVRADDVERVEVEVEAELDRIQAAALASPFPTSVSIPEFND